MGRWLVGVLTQSFRLPRLAGRPLPGGQTTRPVVLGFVILGVILALPWALALYLLWLRLAFTRLGGLEFLMPVR